MEENDTTQTDDGSAPGAGTSPPGGKTHEATTPPGSGEVDEQAVDKGRERLDQAGGGH